MNKYDFGKFVCELRKEQGLTQRQLADKIHVTDKAVSRWENGKNYPDIEVLSTLSKALDISISELLNCKRVTQKEAFALTEQAYIGEVKKNRKNKNLFITIIALILVAAISLTSFLIVYLPKKQNGYSEQEIEMLSSDICANLKNIESCINASCAGSDYTVTQFDALCTPDKSLEVMNIDGNCTNLHQHYAQSLSGDELLDYCKVYQSNFEISDFENGVSIDTLITLLNAMDFKVLDKEYTEESKYSITLLGKITFNNFANKSQVPDDCYLLDGNELTPTKDNRLLSGEYAQFAVFLSNGHSIATIYTQCGSKKAIDTIEGFFDCFSNGDFDRMKQYCDNNDTVNGFFHEDDFFGYKKAALINIYQTDYRVDKEEWCFDVFIKAEPSESSALYDPKNKQIDTYLTFVLSNKNGQYLIELITTDNYN